MHGVGPPQDDWLKRAELAVSKGEDGLAREALKRRKAYQVICFMKIVYLAEALAGGCRIV